MSETVHYKGKAEVVPRLDKTYEEIAIEFLKERGRNIVPSYYDNAINYLCQLYDEEFFYYEKLNALFKLETKIFEQEDEIIKAEMSRDRKYLDFELRFYNGGAGFSECLEEAFDKVDFNG